MVVCSVCNTDCKPLQRELAIGYNVQRMAFSKNEDIIELEEIFNGSDPQKDFFFAKGPFCFSNKDLEFLPLAEDCDIAAATQVIFEKDGIPYINDGACSMDKSIMERLDDNFAKLVEAVVFKKGPPRGSPNGRG